MNNSPFRNTLSNKVNVLCQKINHLSRNIDIHIENKNNLQYEEYFFSSSWSETPTMLAKNLEANIIRINNLIQFSIVSQVGGNGNGNSSSKFITKDPLPERFRPKNPVLVPINIINNNMEEIGKIFFDDDGIITVQRIGSTPEFDGTAFHDFSSLSVSWIGGL